MRPVCRKRVLNSPASDSPILHVLTHRTRTDTGSTRAKDGCPNCLNAFGIHSHPNFAACLAIDWMIDRIESNERTQIGGAANSGTFFALPLVFRACPKDGGRHVRRNYRLIVICNEWNVILFPICFPDALRACIRYGTVRMDGVSSLSNMLYPRGSRLTQPDAFGGMDCNQ